MFKTRQGWGNHMSGSYHINPETGNPNQCRAKPGNCRFGADANHHDTKEDARAAYEERMADQDFETSQRRAAKEVEDAAYDQEGWQPPSDEQLRTYDFDSEYLGEYVDKIEKANRRLEKYGIAERFEYTIEERFAVRETAGGMMLSEPRTKLVLNSPSISIAGNKFLAVVTKEEAGFITKTGTDVDLGGWRPESMKCEHCGINRERNKTYLVEGADGKRHQIGSTCVDAYLGVKPEGLWAIGADPLSEVEDHGTRAPNPARMARPTEHMIAYALAVSNDGEQFVSRSSAMNYGGEATADLIENALWSNLKEEGPWREEMEARAAEYMKNGHAKEVLEVIRKTEGDGDYAENLRTVAAGEMMNPSNSGLLVSGINYLKREREQAAKDSVPPASVGWAGKVGDKMKGKKAKILSVHNIDATDYSGRPITKSKITFRDANNHELIWWASKVIDVEEGADVTFAGGSVKNQGSYKGVDQTNLTRVKFE